MLEPVAAVLVQVDDVLADASMGAVLTQATARQEPAFVHVSFAFAAVFSRVALWHPARQYQYHTTPPVVSPSLPRIRRVRLLHSLSLHKEIVLSKSLAQTVANYTNAAPRAQADWLSGIQNTTVDPTQLAAQAGNAAVSNYTNAWTSGRVQAGLARSGKAGWIKGATDKAQNYATGIANAGPKYQAAMQTWLPIIDSAAAQVKAMPSGSLAASQARASAFMAALYNAKHQQGV